MKKRIKTTDSVLRDIFDTIEDGEKTAAHPLASRSSEETPASNRIESLVEPPAAPGAFERALEEVQKESVLFKDEAAETAETAETAPEAEVDAVAQAEEIVAAPEAEPVQAAPAPVAPLAQAPVRARSHFWITVSVVAVFAVLTVLLGSFLYIQNRQIEKARSSKTAPTSVHPAMTRLSQIDHPGITFKSYSVKNRKLSVKGAASSQAHLVKFLNGINGSPYFTNAIIASIVEAPSTNRKRTFNYQIYTDIRT